MSTDQGGTPVETPDANDDVELELDPALDPDENPDNEGGEEEEFEEIEREGRKHRVPKAIVPELMMHADYTRKTQELGDARKAIEADRTKFQQAQADQTAFIADVAKLHNLQAQMAEFEKADWPALRQQFGDAAVQDAQFRYGQLQREFGAAQAALQGKVQQRQQEATAAQARQLQERDVALAREIPNFTPELRSSLEKIARDNGYSDEEIKFADVRSFKMLKLLKDGMAALEREKRAKRVQQGASVQPAAAPRGTTPQRGPSDADSTDAWMKKRNAELAAKRAVPAKR